MSRAIASARQRRAGITNPDPVSAQSAQQQSQQQSNGSGLTLPQVIALVDTRLIKLESFMKETQQKGQNDQNGNFQQQPQIDHSILDEYNNRFTIIADEIANLKDIVLKLQSFTLEVNRSLLENQNIVVNQNTDDSLFMMPSFEISDAEDEGLMMENIKEE